jgi:DeoR family suf operon transcriptional repressor
MWYCQAWISKKDSVAVANNRWLRRLLAGSRGRIVGELRRAPATVNELTDQLALSANAVRSHLAALERDGIVAMEQVSRQSVGKPAHRYALTTEAHALTPKAYDTMLDMVLNAAQERAGAAGYAGILDAIAERLAGEVPVASTLNARLAATQALLASIGAEIEVERSAGTLRLIGSDCPLAAIVPAHPELCGVLANVISRRLGMPVHECCNRNAPLPRCCFEARVDSAA